jgi:hypothetical protein
MQIGDLYLRQLLVVSIGFAGGLACWQAPYRALYLSAMNLPGVGMRVLARTSYIAILGMLTLIVSTLEH